jgi:hypothetical protein
MDSLNIDLISGGGGGSATPAGSAGEIQYNDGGTPAQLAASVDLTWDDTGKVLEIGGDINLDDGGTYETTLQVVTPTAARTISFPDATGTVALVAGSSGQLLYNASGANAGTSTITYDGTNVTLSGRFISSLNGALSATGIAGVPVAATGTWIAAGGTATTTKPQVLIEPTGTTSTGWSTSGTGFGVNAASGFAGNLLDLQVNGTNKARISSTGELSLGTNGGLRFNGNNLEYTIFSVPWITFSSGNVNCFSTGSFSIGGDTFIFRDAANIFAQRNGTNAQTFRVYGTFTDASNYVRAALSSTSTAVTLAAETAGTGADDIPLNLTAAGTGTVKVNSNLEIADAKDIVLATGTGTKIGTATTQKLGFFGVTPVAQQTELTDELTTITHTAPGTADFAIQNLSLTGYGFVTEDEGNTVLSVIANLQARVNELETKLVALGFLADAD